MTFNSIHGRQIGYDTETGQLIANRIDITQPCVDATITVSAEGASTANTRDITIQLKDAKGNDIAYAEEVEVNLFLDAGRLAQVVTGGSTGISMGTDGWMYTDEAKKRFVVTSEADGDIDMEWLDTGTEVAFLGVKLPSGRYVMSSALTNA